LSATAAAAPDPGHPSEAELRHVREVARRHNFDLIETGSNRYAIADRTAAGGRYPLTGGVTFDEIRLVIRRRARGDW